MTSEEADEFVGMVSEAWKPELTEIQKGLWRDLVSMLDARIAFRVLTKMFRDEKFRPSPPDFQALYKRALIDATPIHPIVPEARDDVPSWVLGWKLSRLEGDRRLWPEVEAAARYLHERVLSEKGERYMKMTGGKTGHDWDAEVIEFGLMPQVDRLKYIERAKAEISQEKLLDSLGV